MYKLSVVLIVTVLCFAHLPQIAVERDGEHAYREPLKPIGKGTLIAPVGDVRAIMGPQGKSIAVCQHGDNIAVIYGDRTSDPDNYMEVKIAYSRDSGASWTTYGPFSPELRRIFPAVDGSPNFCTNPGELYFVWQETPAMYYSSDLKLMVEEGTPSAPSPSSPISLGVNGWFPCVAVNPDDPMYAIVTFWSWWPDGNNWVYCIVTTDGGYVLSDTIPMCYLDSEGSCGHVRFGTGDYVFYTYQDIYNWHGIDIVYPYYLESTEGGYTWSAETPLPEVPLLDPENSMFWWHELDCEVINNEPWAVHNDLNYENPDSADMWVFHGTGSPGSWTWDIIQVGNYDMDTVITDTIFIFEASQYPSVSYDPVSGTILVSYKAYYYKAYPASAPTETFYDGAHIGGIYSTDNGATWTITNPLSEPNTGEIAWGDWSATEVAHRLANVDGQVYSYGIWVRDPGLLLYFERGLVKPFLPLGIEETNNTNICGSRFQIVPSIATGHCQAVCVMSNHGDAKLMLYDTAGRLVERLYDGHFERGIQTVDIKTSKLVNGIYFVILETDSGKQTAKFVVAR